MDTKSVDALLPYITADITFDSIILDLSLWYVFPLSKMLMLLCFLLALYAIFDSNPKLIGKKISTLKIQNLSDIERTIKRRNIKIGFIATTNNYAQEAADLLIENNLYYIINFSGFSPKIPDKVLLKDLDPGLQIESMTYHMRQDRLQKN